MGLFLDAHEAVINVGKIRDGEALTRLLVHLAKMGCIIAEPTISGVEVPDDYVVSVSLINTDPWRPHPQKNEQVSAHWEQASSRGSYASPSLLLLDNVASCGGSTVVGCNRCESDESGSIVWRVAIERTDLSGVVVRHEGHRQEPASGHGVSLAESRARKRAIRAQYAIGTHFPMDVAGKPVVVCRLIERPVKGDAEFDRAYRMSKLIQRQAHNDVLYGSASAAPLPGADAPATQIEAPADEPQAPPVEKEQPPTGPDLGARMRQIIATARGAGVDNGAIAGAAAEAGVVKSNLTAEALDAFERALDDVPF